MILSHVFNLLVKYRTFWFAVKLLFEIADSPIPTGNGTDRLGDSPNSEWERY